ncbi:hypothetical protein EGU54_33010 [Achromobacter aegrifaciens]|nr:hypothetical protein EGU54_33010 [Achromobacter aegrifaciens]
MLEAAQRRPVRMPEAMKVRRRTVEHVFGTKSRLAHKITDRPGRLPSTAIALRVSKVDQALV